MTVDFDSIAYLEAKKSIDDRALNRGVWECLRKYLSADANLEPLRVLELGAGIGTMVERLVEGRMLNRPTVYWAVDADPACTREIPRRLKHWSLRLPIEMEPAEASVYRFTTPQGGLQLHVKTADVNALAAEPLKDPAFDLLLAHSFMDLVDIPALLPALMGRLKPGGLLYFTLNFDGVTALLPTISPTFDKKIIRLYHRSMDERIVDGKPSGDSKAGRHLLLLLLQHEAEILAAGASDWIVCPGGRAYSESETVFLHCMVDFFDKELRHHPQLNAERFGTWIAERRAQIERGALVFMAKQIDILAQKTPNKGGNC